MNNNKPDANLNEALRTSIDQLSEEVVDEVPVEQKNVQAINSGKSIREVTLESFGINME